MESEIISCSAVGLPNEVQLRVSELNSMKHDQHLMRCSGSCKREIISLGIFEQRQMAIVHCSIRIASECFFSWCRFRFSPSILACACVLSCVFEYVWMCVSVCEGLCVWVSVCVRVCLGSNSREPTCNTVSNQQLDIPVTMSCSWTTEFYVFYCSFSIISSCLSNTGECTQDRHHIRGGTSAFLRISIRIFLTLSSLFPPNQRYLAYSVCVRVCSAYA